MELLWAKCFAVGKRSRLQAHTAGRAVLLKKAVRQAVPRTILTISTGSAKILTPIRPMSLLLRFCLKDEGKGFLPQLGQQEG